MRSQRLALCRAYGAKCQGNPVDLSLEHGGHSAMPLWGAPHLTFRPQHQIAQFLHLRMIHRSVVGQGQPRGIEEAGFCAEVLQQARGFFYKQPAERALAGRPVEQQDAWFVLARARQGLHVVEQGEVKVGQVVCHVYSRSKRADSVQLALEFIMAEAVEGKIEKGFAA